jgi:hypothetical protein
MADRSSGTPKALECAGAARVSHGEDRESLGTACENTSAREWVFPGETRGTIRVGNPSVFGDYDHVASRLVPNASVRKEPGDTTHVVSPA